MKTSYFRHICLVKISNFHIFENIILPKFHKIWWFHGFCSIKGVMRIQILFEHVDAPNFAHIFHKQHKILKLLIIWCTHGSSWRAEKFAIIHLRPYIVNHKKVHFMLIWVCPRTHLRAKRQNLSRIKPCPSLTTS